LFKHFYTHSPKSQTLRSVTFSAHLIQFKTGQYATNLVFVLQYAIETVLITAVKHILKAVHGGFVQYKKNQIMMLRYELLMIIIPLAPAKYTAVNIQSRGSHNCSLSTKTPHLEKLSTRCVHFSAMSYFFLNFFYSPGSVIGRKKQKNRFIYFILFLPILV
jgi:hypothetical protein